MFSKTFPQEVFTRPKNKNILAYYLLDESQHFAKFYSLLSLAEHVFASYSISRQLVSIHKLYGCFHLYELKAFYKLHNVINISN